MIFIIALIAAVIAFFLYKNAKKRFNKQETNLALGGLIAALFIAILQCWTIIPAGHVGVIDFFW